MFYPEQVFRVELGCLKTILAVKNDCFELDKKVQPMSLAVYMLETLKPSETLTKTVLRRLKRLA